MSEKPIERINVTELCEKADINRSAFYKHYDDIYALLYDIEHGLLSDADGMITAVIKNSLLPEEVAS